jgi:hypothetical protein
MFRPANAAVRKLALWLPYVRHMNFRTEAALEYFAGALGLRRPQLPDAPLLR